jgi:hypothetical protein
MKEVVLLFVFCGLVLSCFAQYLPKKSSPPSSSWTSFSIGMAIPTQSFGRMEPSNDEAGLAEVGLSSKLDVAVGLGRNAGLIFSLNGFSNGVNEDVLLGAGASAPEHSINTTSWKALGALVGFYGQTTLDEERPSFFGKVQGGYAITRSPFVDILVKSGGTTMDMRQESGSSRAWVFDAGCGLNVPLGDTYMFNIGMDYIFMTSDFKGVSSVQNMKSGSNTTSRYSAGDFTMTLSNLLFQAGIAWRMN